MNMNDIFNLPVVSIIAACPVWSLVVVCALVTLDVGLLIACIVRDKQED